METPIVDTLHHYEYLIDEGHDPFDDPEPLRRYMAQWDGRLFCNLLGDVTGKRILEIGIGTGRVAYEVAGLNSPTDESNVKGSKVSQNHTPMACTHNNKNRQPR